MDILQAEAVLPICHTVGGHKSTLPNVDHRSSENAWLSLLSILTTVSRFRLAGTAITQDWMPAFQKGTAAVETLIQRLQLECTSKAKDVNQAGGNLCRLVHAVLAAISVLRKRLHSVATSNASAAAPGECYLAVGQQLPTFHVVKPLRN